VDFRNIFTIPRLQKLWVTRHFRSQDELVTKMSDEKETQSNEQARTTVVNIRAEDYEIYIGRKGKGEDGYYGNPFDMRNFSRNECLERYQEWFYQRIKSDSVFRENILSLRGKVLGCFCKPKDCHGDIIAEYVNAHFEKRDQTEQESKSLTNGTFDGEVREMASKVRQAKLPDQVLKTMPDVRMIDGVACNAKEFKVWFKDNKAFITTRLVALQQTPKPVVTPRRTPQEKDHQLYEDKLRAMLEA
jgi:hypothetical protein